MAQGPFGTPGDELPGDRKEILQGEEQGLPEIGHDGFLGRSQRDMQGVGPVRGIPHQIADCLFPRRGTGDTLFPGQGPLAQFGVSNLLPHSGCGSRESDILIRSRFFGSRRCTDLVY